MIFISTDILNPYKREVISQDSYKTLIDFLQDKYQNGFKRPTDVSVNGIEIAIDDYDVSLNEKDVIVLLDRAALPVGLIGGWFITALANLAISVTLSYVANKLFAPDAPSEQASPSSVYNINNAQNIARFGSPIPIIYGKVRMFPSMIVQPYYKFENDIEYLFHVLCVGQGTNTTSEILIGSDSITSTGDLDWKLLYQDSFYNIPVNGFGVHITKTLTNPSVMEIEVGDGESEKYTVSRDAEYVEFDYMYPNGIKHYESDGETTSANTSFTMRLYTFVAGVYAEVYSKTFYISRSTIDAIQTTYRLDISQYDEDVFVSFEKTLGKASNTYVTNTIIKRVKAIYPNEDFTNEYGDITLLTVKIKATDAVSTIGQVKVNGYFERTDVGNTMSEVLTDIYTNTTYGGGLSINDLDFPVTTETVNCAYDSSITIFDAMRKPALAQGYSLYLAGMDIILKKDGVNTVTSGMYNEMNILSKSLKVQYLFKEEFPAYDGFECAYIHGCGWIPKTEKYPSSSTRPQQIELFGVVDYTCEELYSEYDFYMIVTSTTAPDFYYPYHFIVTDLEDGTWEVANDPNSGLDYDDFRLTSAPANANITRLDIYKTDKVSTLRSTLYTGSSANSFPILETVSFYSSCDISNVFDASQLFENCLGLKYVRLDWKNYHNITSVAGMARMFYNDTALICLNRIDTTPVSNKDLMFFNTPLLLNPTPLEQVAIVSANGLDYVNSNPCP